MVVALALPLASCLWQWLCHLPLLACYIRGFLSNYVSGNGFVICLHWPASYMALFNVIATILFSTYLHSYIMGVAMAFVFYFH